MQTAQTNDSTSASDQKPSFWDLVRQHEEKSVQECKDPDTLTISPRSFCWALNTRLQHSPGSGYMFQQDLHFLWWKFHVYAKHIPATSATMYRLTFQVLQVREQGTLLSHGREGRGPEAAPTSDGMIWTDLPFFASDMIEFWAKDFAGMSATHRVNFSNFLAKLASVGLLKDKLSGIVLILFRDALESPRSLGQSNLHLEEDCGRTITDLGICDFLPALRHWLTEAKMKIIQLSEKSRCDFPDICQEIGPLYRNDELSTRKTPGFSTERWIFWLRRLDEIHQEAEEVGREDIAEQTTELLNIMFMALEETLNGVRSAFEENPSVVKFRPQEEEGPPPLSQELS